MDMTFGDLKRKVDFLQKRCVDENMPVLITLSDSSIGARAFSEISSITTGIDWENQQIRIEPAVKLYADSRMESGLIRESFSGVNFWACSKCRMKVSKDDLFCKHCGSRIYKAKIR